MNVNGKSVLQSDEQLQAYEFKSLPDYEHTLVWVNPTTRTFATMLFQRCLSFSSEQQI
jgi:hypothetical protein